MNNRSVAPALFLLLSAAQAGAQVVRGRITDVNSSAPVAGALVSLLTPRGDSAVASALTTARGDYALRAPGPGEFRLSAKRIGVRRYVSAPFALGPGETRAFDVTIDAIAMTLPTVEVSGLCVTRARDLRRVASLWDEARTALVATDISLRDRLIRASITRYAAELDPATLRVLFDWRAQTEVLSQQPFTSLSGDSLSAVGYWRALPGDSVEFLAPDASALASNAFLRDHCFGLAAAVRARPDRVGLSFVPARDRTLPDIAGTVWLDARTFELRLIEFRYTMLRAIPNVNRVGGEVHFARLASGAWIVDRWFIRMPQTIVLPDDWPRRQLREEGGAVTADGRAATGSVASVSGTVRDSAGRPLAGAVIRAIGTHHESRSAEDGRYRIDSLPAGGVSLVVHTDGYDTFAAVAATRRIQLLPGRAERVDLRAAGTGALRREFCPPMAGTFATRPRDVRSVVRLLMVDSATAVPLPGVTFMVTWSQAAEVPGAPDRERYRTAVTDPRGAVTFCDVPPGIEVEVSIVGRGGQRSHVLLTQLDRNGVFGRVVMARLNR